LWRRIAVSKYLPRNVAYGKMQAMVEGARMVREEDARAGTQLMC
jgi:hypothetical protein